MDFQALLASLNRSSALELWEQVDQIISDHMWVKAAICYWAQSNLKGEGLVAFARQVRLSPNTVWQYANCFRFFWNEEQGVLTRYAVSFVHHLEVVRSPHLSVEEKHAVLNLAEQEGWSLERLRSVLKREIEPSIPDDRILKVLSRAFRNEERACRLLQQIVRLAESMGYDWQSWLLASSLDLPAPPVSEKSKIQEEEIWDNERIRTLEWVVEIDSSG